jgi:hypothetical protein
LPQSAINDPITLTGFSEVYRVEQLQNYAIVELNLRSFAQSKRAVIRFFASLAFVGARLDWPKGCNIDEQS